MNGFQVQESWDDSAEAKGRPSFGQLALGLVPPRSRPAAPVQRFASCREDCTTDCGHCKGAGRPAPMLPYRPGRRTHHIASADLVPPSAHPTNTGEFHDPDTGVYYVVSGTAGLIEVSVPAQARKVSSQAGLATFVQTSPTEVDGDAMYAACWCDDGRHTEADSTAWRSTRERAERDQLQALGPESHLIRQTQITEVIA